MLRTLPLHFRCHFIKINLIFPKRGYDLKSCTYNNKVHFRLTRRSIAALTDIDHLSNADAGAREMVVVDETSVRSFWTSGQVIFVTCPL